ncbi:MAG: pyridoxal phosphate-dependent aminotransferase family protein [Roseococcus sp.]|nr:pyridoxal phosphate-dependent aminotransferase family protein [Roseococcus sp.]
MLDHIPSEFLTGSTADFLGEAQPDLLARWEKHETWWQGRLASDLDPYSRRTLARIGPSCQGAARDGARYRGVNFASQDYLNLASHPMICEAAKSAIDALGVHSAGSAALMGNTELSVELEERLARFLGYAECTVFPTGWGAGYGAICTLVRPGDHILIDVLAHACLQEGARNSGARVHSFPHLSNEAVERRLTRLRQAEPEAGILVVTETVFSMDSDVPQIGELQAICRRFGATLMVDVAHDLGAIAPRGGGYLELQGMLGQVDVVMGSFSKSFASNGGFVASNAPGLKLALRSFAGPLTFTNALSPVQAAIVLKALDIITSPEGAERREWLMANILRMRAGLTAAGFTPMGQPSAIVPVILGGSGLSRLMTRYALRTGAIVNLVEFPAVSRNTCRWRIQMMAEHRPAQIDVFIRIACAAREEAAAQLAALDGKETPPLPQITGEALATMGG